MSVSNNNQKENIKNIVLEMWYVYLYDGVVIYEFVTFFVWVDRE